MTPSYEFLHALELEIADRLAAARLGGVEAGIEAALECVRNDPASISPADIRALDAAQIAEGK